MLRVDKVIKPWKDSACLNDHINLYGFWNETAFLTKSGDVGMILSVPGVDYESLDRSEQEYTVKRLESALKTFGPGFHVYQYLFKSNRPDIPFARYDDPIVEAAIEQRRKFFEAKRDHLYRVEIFYCILLEGARSKTGVGAALSQLFRDPAGAIGELKAQFTNDNMKTLLRSQIERDVACLDQRVQAFARQLADFMQIEVLDRQGQFTFFRRLLNFDDWRVAGKPQSTQFLDYQVVNSNIEAERDHLRVGGHIVRVLTMKEAITETRPLALDFGFIPVVPPKSNRLEPWQYDKALYRKRNEVERLFRRLKGFRRIFSRFDKLDVLFLGFLNFALIVGALRSVNTP
jgi:type IV secretion system protein VirB4